MSNRRKREVVIEVAHFSEYMKAFIDSSARSRFALLIAVVASVLGFAAFWNSISSGWFIERLHTAMLASAYCNDYWDPDLTIADIIKSRPKDEEVDAFKKSLQGPDGSLRRAQDFYNKRNFYSCLQIEETVKEMERVDAEGVNMIQAPFFGFRFDINDLGLFAGVTFCIVLVWFRFSISREAANLEIAFAEAKKTNHLEYCYNFLSMNQVLTIPRSLSSQNKQFTIFAGDGVHRLTPMMVRIKHYFIPFIKRCWRSLPIALYILPVATQVAIFINDLLSARDLGKTISPRNTYALLGSSVLCILFEGILTYSCWSHTRTMANLWRANRKILRPDDVASTVFTLPIPLG
jgi:hypothetical protein